MAHFIGGVFGNERSIVTRLGHSKITTHANGWNLGITVVGTRENGRDVFRVYKTEGSRGGERILLGTVLDSTAQANHAGLRHGSRRRRTPTEVLPVNLNRI